MQLTLDIQLRPEHTFQNFLCRGNEALVGQLKHLPTQREPQLFCIHGPDSVGKTHLMHALCHLSHAHARSHVLLPVSGLFEHAPDVLSGLESMNCIFVDDIHLVAGHRQWEEAFFHLFNRARDAGSHMVFTANKQPNQVKFSLVDLQSRLMWGDVVLLRPLDETGMHRLLLMLAKQRGFSLSDECIHYLLSRCPRDPAVLLDILEQLDNESLRQQRKITIPFIRHILNHNEGSSV